ncbi:MAG: trypsin-like peptidase domain-containing protein [Burkholderiales bacterium]|nr:trypsin-like peptidase domain-containing protein [Anaerolineae bacterium]
MRQLLWCVLAFCLCFLPALPAAAQESFDLERTQRATVFIKQVRIVENDLIETCVGTGTIVSRDGLVLTNAHNVLTSPACPGDTLLIAMSVRLDEPPVLKYRAEIAQVDPGLDLALLRITREPDGRLIEPGTLAFPFVELADSETVTLDNTITIVGYPGIGIDPVTSIRGTVIGFVAEPSAGNKSWIKTSATIPGTLSGGGAYNQDGLLIGIPTTAPIRTQAGEISCVRDTNRDGLVNLNDICIPIGNFINSLRPSNFARPLLRGAALGLSVDTLTTPVAQSAPTGAPTLRRLFFSPAVNEAGMPTTVVRSLPTGSNSLYLFFDYINMMPDTVYELRVTTDGIPNPTFSLAPVRWSGGSRGLWYIGSSGQPWPNGIYEFTVFANGITADTARLVIGGAPETFPTFSDPIFGLIDLRGSVLGNGYVLPVGNIASARFIYRNMTDGLDWTAIWYYEGQEVFRSGDVWADGLSGSKTISIQDDSGLRPGNYRLELYLEGRLAATSDFTMAGAQEGAFPQIFSDPRFATANTPEDALTATSTSSFPNTLVSFYALFDWQQIARGTLWTMRWSVDDDIFYEQTIPWNAPDTGESFLVQLSDPGGIPDGTYRMDLLVNNVLLATTEAQVGIGQLPIDVFAQASGVQIGGQVIDADTGEGIPGVTFVLVSEDFSVEDFTWQQEQIYALAVTDRNGNFQIDRPLELDALYSVIIAADGYLPITADGVSVTAATANPLEIVIPLTRD